jgi:tryptophanyl-tRNA synthetase
MAADILLYGADLVPVGEDQRQHLELTRDLAIRFNGAYPGTFSVPEPFYPENCARLMSLQNPAIKMSKSDLNRTGVLFLGDDDRTIRKKIRSAVTDSGRELRAGPDKPGITNLLQILSGLTGEPAAQLERRYGGGSYGEFKGVVAEAAVATICPIREKYFALKCQHDYLLDVLADGRRAAQARADDTLATVRNRLDLL